MAISLEPDKILRELRAHTKARDEHLQGIETLLARYPGEWYKNGGITSSGCIDSENAAFELVAYSMSRMVWANPRWIVDTRRSRTQQLVAESMGWFMDRWSRDTDIKTVLEDLAVDFFFGWAVAHVSPQPMPGTYEAEDPMLWPQLSRISPHNFGMDSTAPTQRRARIMFHDWKVDKEDLIEIAERDAALPRNKRERWNVQAIRDLDTVSATEVWAGAGWKKPPFGAGVEQPDREQLNVFSVYLPGQDAPNSPGREQGFNGTLLTIGCRSASDQSPIMLKPPMPFFGPRWGPYTVIGAYIVPDSVWPLSILAATAAVTQQASMLSMAVDAQVAAYKRLGITSDHVLAKLIKDGKNEHIHTALSVNLEQLFREFEIGGTTAPNVAAEQRVIAKRDRAMGFAAQQRGVTTGDTATDVSVANDAANAREAYIRGRFQDGIRRVGRTACWYGYHTDEIEMPLPAEAYEKLGLPPGVEAFFNGGTFEEGSGATFDDLGLEVEPYSMERPSAETLQRHGQFIATLMQLAPTFPSLAQSGADVKGIIDALGDTAGFPHASRLFPDIDSVDLVSMQPAEVAPRVARDLGALGISTLRTIQSGGGGIKPRGDGALAGNAPSPESFASAS